MTQFIRKNELNFSATFTPVGGGNQVPSAAYLIMAYTNRSGAKQVDEVPLTLSGTAWVGQWDSSNANPGNVDWMTYCVGAVQAAKQGSFEIKANSANLSVG